MNNRIINLNSELEQYDNENKYLSNERQKIID